MKELIQETNDLMLEASTMFKKSVVNKLRNRLFLARNDPRKLRDFSRLVKGLVSMKEGE